MNNRPTPPGPRHTGAKLPTGKPEPVESQHSLTASEELSMYRIESVYVLSIPRPDGGADHSTYTTCAGARRGKRASKHRGTEIHEVTTKTYVMRRKIT